MRTLKTFSYRKAESSYKGLNETLAELEELQGNWDSAASYWIEAAKFKANQIVPHELGQEHMDYINRLYQRANDCRKLALEEREV